MSASSSDLTGQWWGEYSYPQHAGPTTPFIANIQEDGGRLTGNVIEPDTVSGGATIEAVLSGVRDGASVDFIKRYGNPAPFGYEEPVDYVGSVSGDGNSITGVWSLLELDGRFEMHREIALEAQAGEDVEVELPVPVEGA